MQSSTDKRLVNLFSKYFSEKNITNIKVKELIPSQQSLYDKHIPIGSLGKFFRNNIDDFKKVPKKFLVADNNRCLFFKNQNLIGFIQYFFECHSLVKFINYL